MENTTLTESINTAMEIGKLIYSKEMYAQSCYKVYQEAAKELKVTPWWKLQRVYYLRTILRWSYHKYKKYNNDNIQRMSSNN